MLFQTQDGKTFEDLAEAQAWEKKIEVMNSKRLRVEVWCERQYPGRTGATVAKAILLWETERDAVLDAPEPESAPDPDSDQET